MITKYEYQVLKAFKSFPNGLTIKEYECLDLPSNRNYYIRPSKLLDEEFIEINFNSVKLKEDLKYVISKKGIEAIDFYEKWINYPHTCEQEEKHTGTKYVIVEHRSGCFCTGIYHMGYTSNIGFTKELNRAKLYGEHKEAEEELTAAIKDSPTKYQNPEDYEFSIEEVNISVNVNLPKTFICKDCGKVYPIKNYFVSTYCPNSWNTGVCEHCIGIRKQREREAMYDRNKRGVFDYDSID